MSTPNDDQSGFGEPSEQPVVDDAQFDQTIGDEGAIRNDEDDATIVEETMAPTSERTLERESTDDDATITDESLAAPAEQAATESDATLMDPSLADQPSPPGADQTVALDGAVPTPDDAEATIVDMSVAAAGDSAHPDGQTVQLPDADQAVEGGASDHTDATVVDESMSDSASAGGHDEATMMDSALAGPAPEGYEATLADPDLAGSGDGSGDAPEATIVQPDNSDADATLIEPSIDPSDPDATVIDHTNVSAAGTGDATEGTVIETEFNSRPAGDQSDFGQTAASAASGQGNWNETKAAGQRRKKSAHETADRWEQQQRYSLVNNFARGGLGQIWLASDTRLRREVAYKEMLPTALQNRNALERFLEEAQITGQLEHPGIVPIYDIGYQANGTPFYSMKLVRGETMEKEIELMHELPAGSPERSLAFRRLLGSFVSVCNAMAFAHDRGVLHRDLKPLNVMLGAFGEALVLDWGLAKILETDESESESVETSISGDPSIDGETIMESSDGISQAATHVTGDSQGAASQNSTGAGNSVGNSVQASQGEKSVLGAKKSVVTDVRSMGSQTMMGSVMGTPSYMPPEQAKGKIDELDGRSDIYSLGGILYKLLTNQQPIPRGKVRDVLKKVIEGEIVPPREHDPEIAKPLEAVCMKAMAKDPEDRYASALDLAADVEAWLADEAVSCFEDPWTVRARRWMNRHPKLVTGVSSSVVLLVVVGIGALQARASRLNAAQQFVTEKITGVAQAVADADFDGARSLINAAKGRIEHESALTDVMTVLTSREKLLEDQRLDHIRAEVEPQLPEIDALIDSGDFDAARTRLAALATMLAEETELPTLTEQVAEKSAVVDEAIKLRDVIAETAKKFEDFLVEADEARAYGSLQEMENIDDDIKLAIERIESALGLFDLADKEEPFANDPPHFGQELVWTRQYKEQNTVWPLTELKEVCFDLLLLRAELEARRARNGEAEEQMAAGARALTWIARAETIHPKSKALLAWKVMWLAQAGDTSESEAVFALAEKTPASTANDFYQLAEADRKRGLFDRALGNYLKAQQLDVNNYWIQHFTALCYLNQGEYRAALAGFSNCIFMRPDYAWPYMLRALCYAYLGRTNEALADFASALKIDPEFSAVLVNRGAVFLTMGRLDEAVGDLTKASTLTPLSAKPLVNLAQVRVAKADAIAEGAEDGPYANLELVQRQALEQQELTKALEALKKASDAERAPGHPGIHQLRGRLLDRQGNTDGAITSLREHIRLELDRKPEAKAESYKTIGYIHFRDGNDEGYEKALTAFLAAASLVQDDPETTGMIAETYLRLKDFAAARREFEKYIALVGAEFRKHVHAPETLLTGMATALEGLGRKREAVQYYTLSVLLNEQVVPLTRRAWALLSYGVPIAIQDFQAARAFENEIGTANPDTLIGLAFAWTQAGDLDAETLKELRTDEGQDPPKPLAEAEQVLEDALAPTAGQINHLVGRGKIGPACALLFNSATAYAQCVRLYDETNDDPEQRAAHVKTACKQLVACLNLAAKVPTGAVLNYFIGEMRTDSSLSPLYGEPEFDVIFQQLKLKPPGSDVTESAE